MERRSPGASTTSSGMSVEGRGHSSRPCPDYTSAIVREALESLASIDLIELCNEAKIEQCRATRDLSSCGRYVQHVLVSCGHASLCGECSQRCDVCPICRTPVPNTGSKLRLRLYNKCIEAGLISKHNDDKFQEKGAYNAKHVMADVHRLYSFFDVALENNLVSLICHYVTDVCMDENAVSSDPVHAFLLDEVVVKDWCKHKFKAIVTELSNLYLRYSELGSHVTSFSKYVFQLGGLSNVLEVLVSLTAQAVSANLNDLHHLLDGTLKVKQHLDVTIWCIKHGYLKDVSSRHMDYISWTSQVRERKTAAVTRAWPDNSESSVQHDGSTLFIEDALSNLGIEKEIEDEFEGLGLSCLQEDKFGLSSADYPFRSLRVATDVLFLRGTSDMMVAKQAIFLYYLFDRHWTLPDEKWRCIIDDFAGWFGISRYLVLESLVFYLLDDHTDEALQTAASILPEIASPETHPKIAQVLLQRQRPEAALMVLRCSGRDGISGYPDNKHESMQVTCLAEAVTAVRVRIECGLLTAAFMYLRTHCSKIKKEGIRLEPPTATSNNFKNQGDSWFLQVEVLVSEFCTLCVRRNLVERMIELPWNADEEKYLSKCLYENACQYPLGISGSLLVVFYLQRYRYLEAYHIDQKLRELESNVPNTNKAEASRKQQISQWRSNLVDKAIELLPEIERQQVKAANFDISALFSSQSADRRENNACTNAESSNPAAQANSAGDSVVLQPDRSSLLQQEAGASNKKSSVSPAGPGSSCAAPISPPLFPAGSVFDSRQRPTSVSRTGSIFDIDLPDIPCNGNGSASNGGKPRATRLRNGIWQELSSRPTTSSKKITPLPLLSDGSDMDSVVRMGKKDSYPQGSSRRGVARWRTDEPDDDDDEMELEFEQRFSRHEGPFHTPKSRYSVS